MATDTEVRLDVNSRAADGLRRELNATVLRALLPKLVETDEYTAEVSRTDVTVVTTTKILPVLFKMLLSVATVTDLLAAVTAGTVEETGLSGIDSDTDKLSLATKLEADALSIDDAKTFEAVDADRVL